jgi:hypothetical protein
MCRLSAFFLLLATACTSAAGPVAESAPAGIVARFQPGGAQDVIEVSLRGRIGAHSVALVGPDGATEPAYRIDVQPARRSRREFGALPASPAPIFGIPGAPSSTTLESEIVTTAFVRVPDVIEYRRSWQAYRIRVGFGAAPGAPEPVTVGAPPPG